MQNKASNKVSMASVPAKTRKISGFFIMSPNANLPHFCPTFNMAALL